MNYLKKLAGGGSNSDNSSEKCAKGLTVSERLQCCIVAFKVMRSNLDALNVDLQGFFVQLYNLILEYRPGRDEGEVLAEALKIMLSESMAALVTLKQLLQKNVKCRNLLENDAGGGSVSGSIAKFQPYATDPNLSGALASVLWELDLLCKHYQPAISTIASSISTMNTSHNQRKRGSGPSTLATIEENLNSTGSLDEDELRKKLSNHFNLLRDFKENEKLRNELDRTSSALQLYEEYKKQKKKTARRGIKIGEKGV
ncbi:hypothetical protein OIU84_006243 [Salix udensis]|uniref:CCAAT-binding factor domain-containing protein n=1 Tax=Salix udensis TaxID=889485 RepID=A0AAD6JY56_9ROSI|nr:hypothetical protein OIU84_006243 [Salix udensis]